VLEHLNEAQRPGFESWCSVSNIPLRPCSTSECPALTSRGRCTMHRRESDALRGSSAERRYDADHRRLRILCFVRDGWRCGDCGWEPEIVEQFRRWGLGAPPRDLVLAELRHRHNRGERHLACGSSGAHRAAARICGSISTTSPGDTDRIASGRTSCKNSQVLSFFSYGLQNRTLADRKAGFLRAQPTQERRSRGPDVRVGPEARRSRAGHAR
jgi:hypothetical protein